MLRRAILLLFVSSLIFTDRFVKSVFLKGAYWVCCGLHFAIVKNSGIAFGLLQGKVLFILSVNAVFILVLAYIIFLGDEKALLLQSALSLMLAGAVSNFIDRLLLGYVVDYINTGWFPVFNLADIFISIGVFLLILLEIMNKTMRT